MCIVHLFPHNILYYYPINCLSCNLFAFIVSFFTTFSCSKLLRAYIRYLKQKHNDLIHLWITWFQEWARFWITILVPTPIHRQRCPLSSRTVMMFLWDFALWFSNRRRGVVCDAPANLCLVLCRCCFFVDDIEIIRNLLT